LKAESKGIGNQIRLSTDLKTLLNVTAEHLQKTLHNHAVVVFTRALCEHGFCATAKAGITDSVVKDLYFDASCKLLTMLDTPLAPSSVILPNEEKSKLDCIGSCFLIPILIKDELIGFISLASKTDNSDYDAEETKFLEAVAAQLGAGINSLRFRGQENEFEEARKIQRGLLPASIPQIPGISIASAWRPASAVSGDYFDVLKFSDSKIALCIADVSGKGMPAALLMSNVQAAVKSFATPTLPPAALCAKVNTVVSSNTVDSKFITLCYCLIDTKSHKLVYANAGHNAGLLVRRDGSMKWLECGGTVLGPFPDLDYEEEEVEYRTGDRILLYTDGVTEVTNQDGDEFGEGRLLELLIEYRHQPAEQLQQTIMSAVAEYSSGSFSDDATIMVVAVE
jgi:sigma-B regulation protein RsbU (phosphoserine phosphatase)